MNSNDIRNSIERLYRRVLYVVGRGRITVVNDSSQSIQYMQVKMGDKDIRDNTPHVMEFGFSSNPPPGTDAILLFLAGDRSNGVVIGTNNQTHRPKDLVPGESIMYDAFGRFIKMVKDGPITIEAGGGEVIVTNASKVRLETPLLEVTGDIIDNCDTNTHNIAQMREIYNEHTHDGVQTGSGDTGNTSEDM